MRRLPALLAPLLLAGVVRAEDPSSLARLLPPDTPVYFETRAPTAEEASELVLYRTLEDPRLKALLSRVVGGESSLTSMSMPLGHGVLRVNSNLSEPDLDVSVSWNTGKKSSSFRIKNRFAVAWCGMAQQEPPLDLVAAVQVEGDPADAIRILRRIVVGAVLGLGQRRDAPDVKARFTWKQKPGRIGVMHAAIGDVEFYLLPIGKLLVLATTRARADDIVARHADAGTDSLETNDAFRELLATAPGGGTPTTAILVRVPEAIDAVRKFNRSAASAVEWGLRSAGLWDLESLSTVTRVDSAGFSSTTAVRFKTPKRMGLARLFAPSEPARLDLLKFAPRDSIYTSCGRFDLEELFAVYADFESLVGKTGLARTVFRERFDLELKQDFVQLVGPEAAIVVAPTRGLIPDVGAVFESADAARLEKTLLRMLDAVDWPAGTGVRSFRLRGTRVHTVPLGDARLAEVPVAPTFGVVDGKLLVALYPVSFQRLAAVARGDRPSILENREFLRLRERVPATAMGLSYLDVARVFELAYDTGVPLLQAAPRFGAGQSLHFELPEADVFSRHLFGRIAWREADEHGFYWRSHNSIDTGGLFFAGIGAGVAVSMLFARTEAEAPAQIVKADVEGAAREVRMCESRVRLLGRRLRHFRRTAGRYPLSLDEIEAPHDRADFFVVPGTEERYTYLGAAGTVKGGVLLHGTPNGPDGRVTVLTMRLRIERLAPDELEKRLTGKPGRRSGK